MPKYLLIYHGGETPTDPAESKKVMDKWTAWYTELGKAVVDPGYPITMARVVTGGGDDVEDRGHHPSGYSVLECENMLQATKFARSNPVLDTDGARVTVCETMDMGGGDSAGSASSGGPTAN